MPAACTERSGSMRTTTHHPNGPCAMPSAALRCTLSRTCPCCTALAALLPCPRHCRGLCPALAVSLLAHLMTPPTVPGSGCRAVSGLDDTPALYSNFGGDGASIGLVQLLLALFFRVNIPVENQSSRVLAAAGGCAAEPGVWSGQVSGSNCCAQAYATAARGSTTRGGERRVMHKQRMSETHMPWMTAGSGGAWHWSAVVTAAHLMSSLVG